MSPVEENNSPTLFHRLGGIEAVRAAVDEFYNRILADDKLSRFFESTSMTALKMHQVQFMKLAFSAIPENVDVVAILTEKHKRLFEQGLNGEHFDLVAGHFVATLQHLGIGQELINEAAGVVVPLRGVFVEGAEKHGPSAADGQEVEEEETKEEPAIIHAHQDDSNEPTLMDKLGGAAALKVAVEEFYNRILADGELSFFFEDNSMTALKMHQLEFMKVAFTQIPKDLDVPKLMKEKHERLFAKGLKAIHFDRVAGHFVATLESLNVPSELVDECVSVVAPLRVVFE